MLSMLKQMLTEDKAESVRQAIVRSLGVIVAFTDDEQKFKQCWELMLHALNDPSQLVVTSTYSMLLPALAAWSFELGSIESELVSYFLHQLLICIKVSEWARDIISSLSSCSLFFFISIKVAFSFLVWVVMFSNFVSPSSPPLISLSSPPPLPSLLPSSPSLFSYLFLISYPSLLLTNSLFSSPSFHILVLYCILFSLPPLMVTLPTPSSLPPPPPPLQQVSRTDGGSGAVEQSQHHLLTLTHLVPWHYATILQTGMQVYR